MDVSTDRRDSDRPDSRLSSVSFRVSTPVSDRDSEMDQSQHSDASMLLGAESLLDTLPLEEPQEVEKTGEAGDQDNAEAIRELKGYLQNCEM